MEHKTMSAPVKVIDDRTVVGYPSIFGNIDSGADRVWKGAFKKTLKENASRVQHLWQHDFGSPPTAKIVSLREVGTDELPVEIIQKFPEVTGGLELTREYLRSSRADEILEGIKAGVITEMSFGYDPIKWDYEELDGKEAGLRYNIVRNLRELRLWDTSDVNWGMNSATVAAKAMQYKDSGIDSATEWEDPSQESLVAGDFNNLPDSERKRVAEHFAWSTNWPPVEFGDLKFAHHKPMLSEVGPAVWGGVLAAMKDLMGNADVPYNDRKAVYAHLARHYTQFGKTAPDFLIVEMSHSVHRVGDIEPVLEKSGRVLSARNIEKLKNALAVLQEILLTAEPPDDEDDGKVQALTESVLRKLAIAQHDPIFFMKGS
jgi:HK97 family phage prohead protease